MILFLDIDGVLNSMRLLVSTGQLCSSYILDTHTIQFLNRHCRDNGLNIVVSSSWRDFGSSSIRQTFSLSGGHEMAESFHDNWRTPELPDKSRGDEIQLWIDEQNIPDDGYIILDDCKDMLPSQMPRFINTDFNDGMRYEHYEKFNILMGLTWDGRRI